MTYVTCVVVFEDVFETRVELLTFGENVPCAELNPEIKKKS